MWVPNTGPELPEPSDPRAQDYARKGNPALLYRDDLLIDDVSAASTRASAVTHRFGGVRYALVRSSRPVDPQAQDGESDSDA